MGHGIGEFRHPGGSCEYDMNEVGLGLVITVLPFEVDGYGAMVLNRSKKGYLWANFDAHSSYPDRKGETQQTHEAISFKSRILLLWKSKGGFS